ncbi:MAG: hypothetical protein F4X26_08750 [Chloroflexi bacterium]|nr:hypothetical protein [Chloroflexota bacterium]
MRLDEQVDRLGSAVLFFVVVIPTMFFWGFIVAAEGIDNWLHNASGWYTPAAGIELVVVPLAALVAGRLHWGMEAIDAPGESHSLWPPLLGTAVVCAVMWWLVVGVVAFMVVPSAAIAAGALRERTAGRGVPLPRVIDEVRENTTPWLPWLGAAVAFAVICYLLWSWAPPQTLVGPSQFGVVRWLGAALVAGVAYLGMVFFPRLTVSLAGAVAGPALFAVAGYILFPSFMQGPEGRAAVILAWASLVGALVVVTAAPLLIAYSEPFRQRALSYAVWTGALTFCLAVFGTINRTYLFN